MVNKVILIGNVGADPEVRFLEGGTAVANIRLATTESYTSKSGERVEQTEWHSVVLWRGLAEITQKYVKKGMKLYIEGRLRTRQWEDKDHIKRYTTEIFADNNWNNVLNQLNAIPVSLKISSLGTIANAFSYIPSVLVSL